MKAGYHVDRANQHHNSVAPDKVEVRCHVVSYGDGVEYKVEPPECRLHGIGIFRQQHIMRTQCMGQLHCSSRRGTKVILPTK